jgi:hypothetical protein
LEGKYCGFSGISVQEVAITCFGFPRNNQDGVLDYVNALGQGDENAFRSVIHL